LNVDATSFPAWISILATPAGTVIGLFFMLARGHLVPRYLIDHERKEAQQKYTEKSEEAALWLEAYQGSLAASGQLVQTTDRLTSSLENLDSFISALRKKTVDEGDDS
jgi:hypothetical protein